MTTSVAYRCSGAVMQFRKLFSKKNQQCDGQTDGWTDGPTNRVTYKKKIDKIIDFLRGKNGFHFSFEELWAS